MLNISSTQPLFWPSVPAHGIAPVSAVTAVAPTQSSARDAQAGLGQGREQPAPASLQRRGVQPVEARPDGNTPEAAPLLPREPTDAPDGQTTPETTEAEARAEVLAEDNALNQQLQDVLSNVWKASAAVVDVVLGRDAAVGETPAPGPATAATEGSPATALQTANAALTPPFAAGQITTGAASDPLAARPAQDPVAYDEHGNSSWAPLEAGSLLSRHV